jgi:3-hydroxybutyryl-CoA dehydratase
MTTIFENLNDGDSIIGPKFSVSRESIRLFCDASLDYNPLHLDDDYMKGNFGKTNFGGIIMHGMNNFGLISRMLTDWAYPAGAIHRRLETRWVKPVRPGDTIQPSGIVKSKQVTKNSRWVLIDVMVRNQNDEKVATGEAMVEFPELARDFLLCMGLFSRFCVRACGRPPVARRRRLIDAIFGEK